MLFRFCRFAYIMFHLGSKHCFDGGEHAYTHLRDVDFEAQRLRNL